MGILSKKAGKGDKDTALYQLALFSAALRAGSWDQAEKASLAAQQTMWSYEGKGKGAASLASSEAIKIFKGEPFEKAMAAIYSGILYYNRGELDNARASFSKALLAIAQKKLESRQDFALAYFLQAKTFLSMGEVDNAKIALEKASKVYPYEKTLFDLERLKKSNAIFLIELGRVPVKTRTGPGDSLIEWQRRSYLERGAKIYVDARQYIKPVEIVDLTEQAKSKGKTGKDTVQAVKGVAREAATATAVIAAGEAAKGNRTAGWVALGAGLFALADQSQADVRQWEFLPDIVLAGMGTLVPGEYELSVRYEDGRGSTISGYGQSWKYTAQDQRDTIFLIPATRCKVNPRIGGK